MKKYFFIPVIVFALSTLALISCSKDKPLTSENKEAGTAANGELYALDPSASNIEWKGYKVVKTESMSHFGNIKFESGEVTVHEGKLESGKFTADMNSLESVDLKYDAAQKDKLESHLKSGDFFETEKYPAGVYEITKVMDTQDGGDYNTMLEGNLTLKGITKPVAFKANVTVSGTEVVIATAPKDIMREDFGVKFQMPVENGLLKNEVNLQIMIKAVKK